MAIIRATIVTGAVGDHLVSFGTTAIVYLVRVAGVAALAGAVQIKNGAAVVETLALASAIAAQREYSPGVLMDNGLVINLASAADTMLIIWGPA